MNGSGGYACMIGGGFGVSHCVGLRRSLTQQVAMLGDMKWCMDIMWSTGTVKSREDMEYNDQVMWSNPFSSNNLWHAMLSTKPEIISPPSAARYTGVAR